MALERHYSPRQASKATGLPLTAIYEACTRRELGHVKFGSDGNIWIPESELQAWRDRHFIPAQQRQAMHLPTVRTPSRRRASRRVGSDIEDLLPPKHLRMFSRE